jgi:CubicO group peptidase (beta-lactamase class C family)
MFRLRLGILWALLGLLVATASGGCGPRLRYPQTPMAGGPALPSVAPPIAVMAAEIDRYVGRLTADDQFSGVVLAIYEGQPVLAQGYGWADRERGYPNLATTRFQIGSLTKPVTALAILMLQAQGRLSVDDSICAYLEPCPLAWRPVSIHQLLTHTSGIPDYVATTEFWERLAQRQVATAELIDLIAAQPLRAPPGAQFVYSSSGYVLLGYIIGHVAHPELPVELGEQIFLEEAIFAPLKMHATGSEGCQNGGAGSAVGYGPDWHEARFCHPSSLFAMGDLSSTVGDLVLLAQAFGAEGLITADLRAALLTSYAYTFEHHSYYGYGWYISELGDRRVIWHAGATPGYRALLRRELDAETIVIILSNYEDAPVSSMGEEIAAIMIRRAKDALRQAQREGAALPAKNYPTWTLPYRSKLASARPARASWSIRRVRASSGGRRSVGKKATLTFSWPVGLRSPPTIRAAKKIVRIWA